LAQDRREDSFARKVVNISGNLEVIHGAGDGGETNCWKRSAEIKE
jgi:hypothetical protein